MNYYCERAYVITQNYMMLTIIVNVVYIYEHCFSFSPGYTTVL